MANQNLPRFVSVAAALALLSACHHSPQSWKLVAPPPPENPPKIFDVKWDGSVDDNNLPLNPAWGAQTSPINKLPPADNASCYAAPQSCTTQPTVIDWAPDPSVCRFGVATHLGGPFPAHVDWTIATMNGVIRPSPEAISDDEDFNFVFLPTNDAGKPTDRGFTAYNDWVTGSHTQHYIELEMDSSEFEDRFALEFWKSFADDAKKSVNPAVDPGERRDARERIDEAWTHNGALTRAVVVGLFGVDCEHGCRSELHPVYAMAVETDASPVANRWAVFVRNWGGGGSCSTLNHEFSGPSLAIRIPPPSDAVTSRAITEAAFSRSEDSIQPPRFVDDANGKGIVAQFSTAPPATRPLEELTLTISWTSVAAAPVARAQQPPVAVSVQPASAANLEKSQERESAYILRVVNGLPADRRDEVRRRLVEALKRPQFRHAVAVPKEQIDFHIYPRGSKPAAVPAPATRLRDIATPRTTAMWSILCDATNGHPPAFNGQDMSAMCKK